MLKHEQTRGVPLVVVDGAKALVEVPLHRLVDVAQRPGDGVVLIGVNLVPELYLLLYEGPHQHQCVLLVHQGVGSAVHQHQVTSLDVAGLHGEVRLLQRP